MLGQRLRSRRKEIGLTQEQLAEQVKTKKTTISNYETGYSTPNNEMLSDLADVLRTTSDYLLGRTDDPTPNLTEQLIRAADKAKQGGAVKEQSAGDEAGKGRAFFGGAVTEEEQAIAEAAARAAVEAYRRGKKSQEDK